MQNFKSTIKLTPEFFAEFQQLAAERAQRIIPIPDKILYIILAISSFLLLLMRETALGVFGLTVIAVYYLYNRFVQPAINRASVRAQLNLNEKKTGTPTPTCETWLEDSEAVSRIVESGETERYPLSKTNAYISENYIFLRNGLTKAAAFAKSDFTEDELAELLQTLEARCRKIVPRNKGK